MFIKSAHNTLQILEIKVKQLHSHNTHCSTRHLYLVDCPYSMKPIWQFLKFIKMTVLIWILLLMTVLIWIFLLVDSTYINVVGKGLMLSVHQNYVFVLICYKTTDSWSLTHNMHHKPGPLTRTTVYVTSNIHTSCPVKYACMEMTLEIGC